MRRLVILWAVTALFAAMLPAGGAIATPPPDSDVVAGSYIVVLRAGEPGEVAAEHSRAHNAEVTHVYRHALRGYAARMSEQAAARIANDPRVDYVDVDRVVTTAHHQCGHVSRGLTGPCDEPATGTITGTVVDNSLTTATPIAGATVTVGGTTLSAQTASDGSYTIGAVPEGDRSVTAAADSFEPQQKSTTVVAGQTTQLDFALSPSSTIARQPVPWGIERVGAPLESNTGEGVHVYVLDTGIDPDHRDLNVSSEGYAAETCKGGSCAAPWDDDHGHGTHVAGTIGALDNAVDVVGVAPKVTLHAVKVLSHRGSGTNSGVIAGIDWVAGHNTSQARVANMSLSGAGSKTGTCTADVETPPFIGTDSYHEAICNATHAGVVFAVAAGNSGADAAGAVPAAYDDTVVTVSATTDTSDWPSWSNWGDKLLESGILTKSAPVGIAAPGVDILSTQAGGGTTTKSGTSMAAPHVAGAMALFLRSGEQPRPADYTAFSNARTDLLESRAQATSDASGYINGWKNTSGKPHAERFLQVTGL